MASEEIAHQKTGTREISPQGSAPGDMSPTPGQVAAIGVGAIFLRVAVFLTVTLGLHFSFHAYTDGGDGISYQAYARAIAGDKSHFALYDTRVFPGYPALIAVAHGIFRLGIFQLGIPGAALAVTWVSAAISAMLAAIFFRDRRVGWAMVMLLPHWPINSSLPMSEAPMLALTLAGLLFSQSRQAVVAGILLGCAALVRPVAVFPLAGCVAAEWVLGRRQSATLSAVFAAAIIVGGLAWVRHITGSAFQSIETYTHSPGAYGGRLLGWPFQALFQTPRHTHIAPLHLLYIYAHVALVLGACGVMVGRWRWRLNAFHSTAAALGSALMSIHLIALCWLIGNTLFALCIGSGPYGWGFFHFPRFIIPAMPPLLWAVRCLLPRQYWVWGCILVIVYVASVAGVRDALLSGPLPRIFVS